MDHLQQILSEVSHLDLDGQIVNIHPFAAKLGGSCDVFTAWSSKHKKKVAVKQIRWFMGENTSFAKRLAREIRVWASIKHKNVLPLLGYFTVGANKLPNLVSEWMVDGTMTDYMKTFPRCSVDTLRMLLDIASGLSYLHDNNVIHADLKSGNILISRSGTPLLTDFGLSQVLSQTLSTSQAGASSSASMLGGTVRWMAQELFTGTSEEDFQRHDKATDVWAFGMVIYELVSWKVPYAEKRFDHNVIAAITKGALPMKPEAPADERLFDHLWKCCISCWSPRSSRPLICDIAKSMSSFYEADMTHLCHLDLTDQISDMTYDVKCEIHRAFSRKHHIRVEVNTLRLRLFDALEIGDTANKWITLLSGLDHPNVVRLLGFYFERVRLSEGLALPYACIASEWLGHGSVEGHMKRFPRGGEQTLLMAHGIASGLSYLLSKEIYCIRLQCARIFVSSTGVPIISDFRNEANTICEEDIGIRWMAPELFPDVPHNDPQYCQNQSKGTLQIPTAKSNSWALGMVIHELLSGFAPYYEIQTTNWKNDVKRKIKSGVSPNIFWPASQNLLYTDELKEICRMCCSQKPTDRISVRRVSEELGGMRNIELASAR